MKYFLFRLKRFCGFLTGFVFFISGVLKLMDPVGSSLVMKEYFDFLHIGFLDEGAKTLAIMLAFAETLTGTGLITGVWRKIVAPTAIAFQAFFTALTLLLVIFKPQMDCGCFGEAISLSHEDTFIKNLILLALLLIYYIPSRHLGLTRSRKYISFAIVTVSVMAFTFYSLTHLPLNDYTDFHTGVSLDRDSQAGREYQAIFVYEKDGTQEVFTIDNLPDTTWTFISSHTTTNDKENDASATLSFHDPEGTYADSLALKGKVIIISLYDTDVRPQTLNRLYRFAGMASEAGFKTILLASSPLEQVTDHTYYIADYKTLITLNRSNGGATYIDNGIIVRKWSKKSLPTHEELAKIYNEDVTETLIENSRSSLAFQGFLLYVFAVMLLL